MRRSGIHRWWHSFATAIGIAGLAILLSNFCDAEEDRSKASAPASEFKRPELVAITWRMPTRNWTGSFEPAWRPDGSRLDAEEAAWLKKELASSSLNDWQYNVNLRPLILIFRCDEETRGRQAVIPHLRLKERVLDAGDAHFPSKNSLVISSLSPPLTALSKWPSEIDVDVRAQVAPAEKIKSIDELPTEPMTVDTGVRWYFDPEAGRSPFGQYGYPAWVLEIDRTTADPLKEYFFNTKLKDGAKKNSFTGMWSGTRIPPFERKVTKPIDSENEITGVEFLQVRYRIERFEKIPTHVELMPQ